MIMRDHGKVKHSVHPRCFVERTHVGSGVGTPQTEVQCRAAELSITLINRNAAIAPFVRCAGVDSSETMARRSCGSRGGNDKSQAWYLLQPLLLFLNLGSSLPTGGHSHLHCRSTIEESGARPHGHSGGTYSRTFLRRANVHPCIRT